MSAVKVTQVRSQVGARDNQLATLRSLRLGKIGRTAEHPDTEQLRGMVRTVSHLVKVES